MKDVIYSEFVSYEEALKLKELGFKEPTFFAFDECQMRCSNLVTNEQKFNGVNYNSSPYVSQPSYRQAFKFFQDKCSLYVNITAETNVNEILGFNLTIVSWRFAPMNFGGFLRYELAEQIALYHLIDLTNIRK